MTSRTALATIMGLVALWGVDARAVNAREALTALFPGHTISASRKMLTAKQRTTLKERFQQAKYVPRVWSLYEISSDKGLVSYAGGWKIMGKHAPIRTLIVCDRNFSVTHAQVLHHAEIYGRAIDKRAFLDQFTGKKRGDTWRLACDVDGITGATVSSTAMLKAVRNSLWCISEYAGSPEAE